MISGGTRDSADETSEERIDEFDLNRFQPLNSILFHEIGMCESISLRRTVKSLKSLRKCRRFPIL